ncbi:MAG TPA: enoyl-CoA hydratase/isomerase family protein [Deltaproteobacteria bacterium]|nr:enoyl-CoA hydratase/isomerase family protein [Deltaproteobacteria bacterium]
MAIVEWKRDEHVALLTLNTAENRHNPDFVKGMLAALEEIEKDAEISGIVITSSSTKNWSLGIDLEWITGAVSRNETASIKEFMYGLNAIFKKILTIPMPVIAAINGHTFGDGTILACVCDFRFMRADRGYFCFPEVDLSIPFLPGMLAIVRKAIPYYKLEDLVYTGKRAGAKELEDHHVLVKASENEEALLQDALDFAKGFKKKRAIFGEHKVRLHKHILEIIEREDPAYIEPLNLMV